MSTARPRLLAKCTIDDAHLAKLRALLVKHGRQACTCGAHHRVATAMLEAAKRTGEAR